MKLELFEKREWGGGKRKIDVKNDNTKNLIYSWTPLGKKYHMGADVTRDRLYTYRNLYCALRIMQSIMPRTKMKQQQKKNNNNKEKRRSKKEKRARDRREWEYWVLYNRDIKSMK